MKRAGAMCLAALLLAGAAEGATLRIGLNEDPDALDPARGGSFVGRVVFAAVCDKLIDTTPRTTSCRSLRRRGPGRRTISY